MIKCLSIDFLEESLSIIKDVVSTMKRQGIDQWDEIYPRREDVYNDIQNNEAFGYFEEDKLCGYIALNDKFSTEYNSINWSVEGKALIVHRLSVLSSMQRKGIAKECMKFAEEYAKKNGYHSIRLDAFTQNQAALKVYERLEYTRMGSVTFRKGIFYCYEKRIDLI